MVITLASRTMRSSALWITQALQLCFGVLPLVAYAYAQGASPPMAGFPSTTRSDPPGLAACVFPKLTVWIKSQGNRVPATAVMAKKEEVIAECGNRLHLDIVEQCNSEGTERTLLPLNYATADPQKIQLPSRGPGRLQIALDKHLPIYILYEPMLSFVTPSWDSTQSSLEHLYVWWLDLQKKSIRRTLLPQGPWMDDAKRDVTLGRALQNFSCGIECYRHYEIAADAGTIFATISGRTSALSESTLGTYKLSPGDAKWVKIRNGKPSE